MNTINPLVASDVELLRRAVELAKSARKAEAQMLLAEACLINPFNEKAWLWRASLAPSPVDAVAWLERVLAINPNNDTAHNWMRRLRPVVETKPVPEPVPAARVEPAWTCPLCSFESPRELSRCTDCGGITTFDLEQIEKNSGTKEFQFKHAVEHYFKMLEGGDAVYGYYLALAQLNLRRSYDAHASLRQYLAKSPRDVDARNAEQKLALRKLVLAVDDSPTVRSVVSDALERAGYRCATASNGVDGVGFLRSEPTPDFILLDVSMPLMDGYQLCKTIKQMPKAKDVPVVMLSGNDGFIDKVKGRMAGASDYLIKPFNAPTLLQIVRKLTQGKKSQ